MVGQRFTSYQVRVLAILALVNFVNYVDRQILYPLFPLIAQDFQLTNSQLGLLAVAFSLVHAVASLPLGRLADVVSRKKVISYAVLFWSGATFLSGLAGSFRSLMAARAMVGVGEAAYSPAGTAMITASFPHNLRARVQGVFDVGMFIGGAVGIALGGILAERWGWRSAFFMVGIPGLLLAFSVLRLPGIQCPRPEKLVPVSDLLRVPAYVMLLVSGWFTTFAAHAYIIWGPMFVQKYKGFGVREAGVTLGGILVVAGVLGVMAGASIADRLSKRLSWGRVVTVSFGFLISAPLLLWVFHTPSRLIVCSAFFVGCFFMSWYHGPVTAIMHDLTPPRAHASAMAIYYFWVNLFATIPAAWVIGKIADRYGLLAGMHTALAAQVCGGLSFLTVIYFIRRHGLRHPALSSYQTEPAPLALPVGATATSPL